MIMDMDAFQRRLAAFFLSDAPAESTLRRWATYSEGLIHPPRRYSKGAKGGRGRFSDWPEESVEDAAACWYIRQIKRPIKRPSITALNEAKRLAKRAYTTPFGNPFWLTEKPGGFQLYPLVVRWICTVEKIRHKRPAEPVRVAFNWSTERARIRNVNELILQITLEQPSEFTEELSDFGQRQHAAMCERIWTTDRFSTMPNEDQVVFRIDGSNTIGHTANGVINMLGNGGINFRNFDIVQKRENKIHRYPGKL
ncbi:MAG: hypothetical protein ACXVIB_06630 [Halobacteriota archaeon]